MRVKVFVECGGETKALRTKCRQGFSNKNDVLNGLKNATRSGVSKGEYEKGQQAFDILGQIDPKKEVAASPQAKELVKTLNAKVR